MGRDGFGEIRKIQGWKATSETYVFCTRTKMGVDTACFMINSSCVYFYTKKYDIIIRIK